jgi:hypothetical protein
VQAKFTLPPTIAKVDATHLAWVEDKIRSDWVWWGPHATERLSVAWVWENVDHALGGLLGFVEQGIRNLT